MNGVPAGENSCSMIYCSAGKREVIYTNADFSYLGLLLQVEQENQISAAIGNRLLISGRSKVGHAESSF